MESTTAATLVTDAYTLLNVITLGTAPDARLSAQGLRFLNMMIGVWAQMPLTIPVVVRENSRCSRTRTHAVESLYVGRRRRLQFRASAQPKQHHGGVVGADEQFADDWSAAGAADG